MSVIVYRDKVMASDTSAFRGDAKFRDVRKIARVKRASDDLVFLIGGVGDFAIVHRVLLWAIAGMVNPAPEIPHDPENKNESLATIMIVAPNGEIELMDANGSYSIRSSYMAIGAGSQVALGALWQGATAVEAVEAAGAHNAYVGRMIDTVQW